MDLLGAYAADRAAALSGVPQSTIHWWARNEILIPSVSAERVKLWSMPT
jgi:DNA-binding transcriptional MerR regulator